MGRLRFFAPEPSAREQLIISIGYYTTILGEKKGGPRVIAMLQEWRFFDKINMWLNLIKKRKEL